MPRPAALPALLLALALASPAAAQDAQPVPGKEHGRGYLAPGELPDSLALLPPPPTLGSPAEALDRDVARQALTLEGGARYKLAAVDADLRFPNAAGAFACALGVGLGPETTPTLYALLQKTMTDAGAATRKAKDHYRHARPFMLDEHPTCEPDWDEGLRSSGSYPSGHAAIGWTWGEILSEIAPEKADAVMARARAFGESRLICNAHWASDVMEGRLVGAATAARLHASAAFREDVLKARDEIELARAAGAQPQRDCGEEAEALAQAPWLAP